MKELLLKYGTMCFIPPSRRGGNKKQGTNNIMSTLRKGISWGGEGLRKGISWGGGKG